MNKKLLIAVIAIIVVLGAGALIYYIQTRPFVAPNNVQVRDVVYAFGDEMSLVSLAGPNEEINASIDKHYAIYAHPDLMASWKADHTTAPGKRAGQPVTDRIDIKKMEQAADGTYIVEAELVSKGIKTEFSRDVKVLPVRIVATQGPDGWQITEYKELVAWGA